MNHLPPLLVTANSTIARRFNIRRRDGEVTEGGKQINISSVALYLSYLFHNGTATIPILHVPSSRPRIAPAVSSNLLRAETPVDLGNLHPPWSASLAYYFPFYPTRRVRGRFLLSVTRDLKRFSKADCNLTSLSFPKVSKIRFENYGFDMRKRQRGVSRVKLIRRSAESSWPSKPKRTSGITIHFQTYETSLYPIVCLALINYSGR